MRQDQNKSRNTCGRNSRGQLTKSENTNESVAGRDGRTVELLAKLEALEARLEALLGGKEEGTSAPLGERLLTAKQVASLLSVSLRTLEAEIAEGRIAFVRIRGSRRFAPAAIRAYVNAAGVKAQREGGRHE